MRIPTLGPGIGSGLGYKWQSIVQTFRNEDTVSLPAGVPVILKANATDDGVAVVLPNTAATANSNGAYDLVAGILGNSAAVNDMADVICYGMITNARIVLATRSASTAAWPSWAAIATGDMLVLETVNNGLQRSTVGGTAVRQDVFVAFQSVASGTTQASSFTLSGAVTSVSGLYTTGKVFVRAM